MKIAIIGPGAIGSLFAAYLAEGGLDVTLVDNLEARAAGERGSVPFHGGSVLAARQQLGHRDPGGGVDLVRGQMRQRDQDEAPLGKARVRHLEPGFVHGQVAVKQQIDVQGARPPVDVALAMVGVFDSLHGGK